MTTKKDTGYQAAMINAIRIDVSNMTARGELPSEDAIRDFARRLGMGAAELSAAVGAWPVCADD